MPAPTVDPVAVAPDSLRLPADSLDAGVLGRELARLNTEAREALAAGRLGRADELSGRALAIDRSSAAALRVSGSVAWSREQWRQAALAWEAIPDPADEITELATLARLRHLRQLLDEVTPAAAPLPQLENPFEEHTFSLRAIGDMHMGEAWPDQRINLPPRNGRPLFDRVRPLLQDADLTFGNVETVIADSGQSTKCRPRSRACYAFRVPSTFATTLQEAGFDLLSTNNNHASDFGDHGKQETTKLLEQQGLAVAGPLGVARWKLDSLEIAAIAFSTGGGDYRIQEIDSAAAMVRRLDREADLVIVSFHGGAEGAGASHVPRAPETAFGEDRGDVWAFSRAMIDNGADLVLGHGPHVLRAMEVYRGRFIAYSLGNFTTWNTFGIGGARGLSVVLDLTLSINGGAVAAELIPLRLRDEGIPTPDPTAEAIAEIRRLSEEDLGSPLFSEQGVWRFR